MAEMLNLHRENSGTPTMGAAVIFVKFRIAEPSAFVIPCLLYTSIAACVFAEVIIIPRQDSIQNNACDCRNGEGGQCDICVGNIEGQSIGDCLLYTSRCV